MRINPNEEKWYALYTRFKSEKIAKLYFDKVGIKAYVPTLRKTKKYTRKIKHYDIPLISCYVFIQIREEEDRIKVLKNPYIIQFVNIGGEISPIPDAEISILKKICGEFNNLEMISADMYERGDEVEVIRGNLTGLKGFVLENRGKQDIVIELSHIDIHLKIHIDPSHIRRIRKIVKKTQEEIPPK